MLSSPSNGGEQPDLMRRKPPITKYRREDGFTLIELLIVLVVIGILLAIAVPSYLGFRDRAADTASQSVVRAAAVAATAYAIDNTGEAGDADNNAATKGFEGMTRGRMRKYDRAIPNTLTIYRAKTTETTYCLRSTHSGSTWSVLGPALTYSNNNKCN